MFGIGSRFMAFFRRVFRIFWIGLLLILLGTPTLAFLVAKAAEQILRSERHVGEWTVQFHGARVSSLVNFKADSALLQSPHERIFVSGFSVHLLDWAHLWSRRAVIRVTADSAEARLGNREQPAAKPVQFPELRFPLPLLVEWRVLRVYPAGGPAITLERAQWRSHGPWGFRGRFHAQWEAPGSVS